MCINNRDCPRDAYPGVLPRVPPPHGDDHVTLSHCITAAQSNSADEYLPGSVRISAALPCKREQHPHAIAHGTNPGLEFESQPLYCTGLPVPGDHQESGILPAAVLPPGFSRLNAQGAQETGTLRKCLLGECC